MYRDRKDIVDGAKVRTQSFGSSWPSIGGFSIYNPGAAMLYITCVAASSLRLRRRTKRRRARFIVLGVGGRPASLPRGRCGRGSRLEVAFFTAPHLNICQLRRATHPVPTPKILNLVQDNQIRPDVENEDVPIPCERPPAYKCNNPHPKPIANPPVLEGGPLPP